MQKNSLEFLLIKRKQYEEELNEKVKALEEAPATFMLNIYLSSHILLLKKKIKQIDKETEKQKNM